VTSPPPESVAAAAEIAGTGVASDYARALLGELGVRTAARPGPADRHPALAWAASGAMALTGWPDALPRVPSGALAASAEGAARALAALGARAPADAPALLGERAALLGLARRGRTAPGGSCRLLRAADGWGALNLAREDDRRALCAWLEVAAPPADLDWPLAEREVRRRPLAWLAQRAQWLGLAFAPASQAPPRLRWLQRQACGPRAAAPARAPRVLDFSSLWAGPLCAALLADAGADVVKVEDTGMGDYVRWSPPYVGTDEHQGLGTRSALYLALNRGKRSIRLDLKSDGGRDALLRLAEDADVVLESFRPGVLDRLGCGYDALRERNPRIVYCAITGYGQTGPNTARAGHDTNYLALGGLLGLTGAADGPPVQAAGQVADLGGGGLMGVFGILAALWERERSGEGQFVDVSMTDGAQSWLAMVAGAFLADGRVPHRGQEMLNGGVACYLPYECADGWVSVGALEPKFWQAFCAGVERPDLLEHQFAKPRSEGHALIAEVFAGRSKAEWAAFNDEHDCCIEPVLDLDEALASDLTRERDMVVELDQPEVGPVRLLGMPVKFSRTPGDATRPAPALGEHTEDVLRAAGIDADALLESGAAAGPSKDATGSFMG
jgi:crotonobetainyl-CoA:carnitine CoA-transferase CaiB-like acyl-CoA transferase